MTYDEFAELARPLMETFRPGDKRVLLVILISPGEKPNDPEILSISNVPGPLQMETLRVYVNHRDLIETEYGPLQPKRRDS